MPDDSLHLGEAMQINGSVALVTNAGVLKYSTFINAPSLEAARATG
jgi:hypothetical protein